MRVSVGKHAGLKAAGIHHNKDDAVAAREEERERERVASVAGKECKNATTASKENDGETEATRKEGQSSRLEDDTHTLSLSEGESRFFIPDSSARDEGERESNRE